jgi:hypothetical protein
MPNDSFKKLYTDELKDLYSCASSKLNASRFRCESRCLRQKRLGVAAFDGYTLPETRPTNSIAEDARHGAPCLRERP